jgi:hypothetical protein
LHIIESWTVSKFELWKVKRILDSVEILPLNANKIAEPNGYLCHHNIDDSILKRTHIKYFTFKILLVSKNSPNISLFDKTDKQLLISIALNFSNFQYQNISKESEKPNSIKFLINKFNLHIRIFDNLLIFKCFFTYLLHENYYNYFEGFPTNDRTQSSWKIGHLFEIWILIVGTCDYRCI